jgi:hypothetical protein
MGTKSESGWSIKRTAIESTPVFRWSFSVFEQPPHHQCQPLDRLDRFTLTDITTLDTDTMRFSISLITLAALAAAAPISKPGGMSSLIYATGGQH